MAFVPIQLMFKKPHSNQIKKNNDNSQWMRMRFLFEKAKSFQLNKNTHRSLWATIFRANPKSNVFVYFDEQEEIGKLRLWRIQKYAQEIDTCKRYSFACATNNSSLSCSHIDGVIRYWRIFVDYILAIVCMFLYLFAHLHSPGIFMYFVVVPSSNVNFRAHFGQNKVYIYGV